MTQAWRRTALLWLLGLGLAGPAAVLWIATPQPSDLEQLESELEALRTGLERLAHAEPTATDTLEDELPKQLPVTALLALVQTAGQRAGISDLAVHIAPDEPADFVDEPEEEGPEEPFDEAAWDDPSWDPEAAETTHSTDSAVEVATLDAVADLRCGYAELARFLAEIERTRPMVRVRSLHVLSGVGQLEITLRLSAFTVGPPAAPDSAAGDLYR